MKGLDPLEVGRLPAAVSSKRPPSGFQDQVIQQNGPFIGAVSKSSQNLGFGREALEAENGPKITGFLKISGSSVQDICFILFP